MVIMNKDKLRLIKVSEKNYQRLKRMGIIGETFNDVVERLFEQYRERRAKSKITKKDTEIMSKMG